MNTQDFSERQLISQFMGGEADTHVLVPFEYWSGEPFPFTGNDFNQDEDADNEVREELKEYTNYWELKVQSYHNSWDMLIPVVERCLDILGGEEDHWYHKIKDAWNDMDIQDTYKVVLECINHINKK